MKITLAQTAGFCRGVDKAVNMALDAGKSGKKYVTLGPIIHNADAVAMLEKNGVRAVESIDEVPEGYGVIIRSHGVGDSIYRQLESRGIEYLDATCPYVTRVHNIVKEQSAAGRFCVIMGKKDHPEVVGIADCGHEVKVAESAEEFEQFVKFDTEVSNKPLCVVFQTTNAKKILENCSKIVKKDCKDALIFDTICRSTEKRQEEAAALAKENQTMIVLGDRSSSNTGKLYETCRGICPQVVFASNASELDINSFAGTDSVAITAGASTPGWIIKEVCEKMSEEIIRAAEETAEEIVEEVVVDNTIAEDDSFETMLNKSFKTLTSGEKVTGIVTAVNSGEVCVDLGTKHAGYIPLSEISDDPSVKPEDLFKVGDEVECFTVRVNDAEGTAMLSKKRLDTVKTWETIENAVESREIMEGTVTEENKGGIVVSVKGVRVFVPASHTGLAKGEDLSTMLKTKVRLRITEVNKARRRVVGSIRDVLREERKAASEALWSTIEAGNKYTGTVKSLTSYGAFVDIGGVDGMVHVSELSWSKIKNPAEVLSVGQQVDVYVIAVDTEKKKISLGYKDPNGNPWTMFTTQYNVGDVANVKILKLMTYGAFAQILPGVDGLIHISQIADKRINKTEDVLTVGQEVDAKITDIDFDKHKVSLSIRALLAPEAPAEEAAEAPAEDEVVAVFDGETPVEE
ncbi:MAG: bifunctional 4-hydroxy-3-methylbut-2-enyl diphosphate reductase/30S ribosomal protein S1 [Oscillospiraceae bacterium]|nr:bifunctional 4-hydroxy-3-methylbut-2-enyl diphosphate reductase/30S ribosomal protein S1 [Oscillospiraceae bacterium]